MPGTTLDVQNVCNAAETFRKALQAFEKLAKGRAVEDRSKQWPPACTEPVRTAAAALRNSLTPSNPGSLGNGPNADISNSGLPSKTKKLLQEVWHRVASVGVEGETREPLDPNYDADDWDALLEELLGAIRPESLNAPSAPTALNAPRITTNADTKTVIYDGRDIVIDKLTVFKLFAVLVLAHNEGRTPISRHELFKGAGRSRARDPRPDRVLKGLPAVLFNLIESEAVPDGGYSLKMPTRQ